jgi:hypothetical protein
MDITREIRRHLRNVQAVDPVKETNSVPREGTMGS